MAVTDLQRQVLEAAVFLAVEEMGRTGLEVLLAMGRRAQFVLYGPVIPVRFHQQIQETYDGVIYSH